VDSAVVRMVPLADCRRHWTWHCAQELVQVAFSQRRKLLRHTLGRWLERGFAGNFDVQRRAEEVPVDEYIALVQQAQPSMKKPVGDGLFPEVRRPTGRAAWGRARYAPRASTPR
jgi:hypothetical protein